MVTYDLALPVPATGEVPTETQCRLAQAAEGTGYDHVLVPESWGREAFVRLGYFAAQVETIGLGTGIVPVPLAITRPHCTGGGHARRTHRVRGRCSGWGSRARR